MKTPELTVIVVNYNVKDLVLACLRSLYVSSDKDMTEVIVVDNTSIDGSVDAIKQEFPGVRLIANTENVGFARACNQGAAMAGGEVLLFLNPDTVVNREAVAGLVSVLKNNPKIGIAGPQLVYPDGRSQASAFRFVTPSVYIMNSMIVGRLLGKVYKTVFGRPHTLTSQFFPERPSVALFEPDYITGACLAIRREVFKEVGGFPENCFIYNDDTALAWRAKSRGYSVVSLNRVSIVHHHQQSRKHNLKRALVSRQTSKLAFARDNLAPIQVIVLRLLVLLELVGRLPIYAVLWVLTTNNEYKQHILAFSEVFRRCVSGDYYD